MLENPLQRSDNHFLDELVRKQQASQDGKPRQGALYFVSFSIPEEGLKRCWAKPGTTVYPPHCGAW